MAKPAKDVEMISAPNMLQIKIGGPLGPADLQMIENAEEALKDMRGNFQAWLEEEVGKLEDAANVVKSAGLKGEEGESFFVRAHDLRGVGATYEFPIISRLAASLAKMLDEPEKRQQASLPLALAHVAAIRAAVSQNIRDDEDEVASALAQELESQSAAFCEPWKD